MDASTWVRFALPGIAVAISWNGFWLYLGALDLTGVKTRTVYTVAAYTVIAAGLAVAVWLRRDRLVTRIERPSRLGRVWLASAALLAVLFAYGTLVSGHGPLAHRLLGVFVVSTIPLTIAVVALSELDLSVARGALVALGLLFAAINVIAAHHGALPGARYSPIADLDPVSASLISVTACIAALTYRFGSNRANIAQACVCFVLAASAMLNAGRGPVVALVAAAICLLLIDRRATTVAMIAALALGLVSGREFETRLIDHPPGLAHSQAHSQPISSLSIRREWLSSALRKFPQRPIFGHGIGMLVDDTPEATEMGVPGQLVYPHNDSVEALYSLGLVGGALFALLMGLPMLSWWRNRARLRQPIGRFALVFFVFAFAESNFSGEIGTDAILWSLAALAVLGIDPERYTTQR